MTNHYYTILFFVCVFIAFTGCTSSISVEKLKTGYANGESEFMTIKGMNVHFRDEGPERARPILLLHDKGSSLHTFDHWADTLKLNYRVIRLDLPGFGLTGPNPKDDYSMEMYRTFLDEFMAQLGVKWCYAVGNGLGGRLAWELALTYPKRVKKLVLIGSEGYPTDNPHITPMDKKASGTKMQQRMFKSFMSKGKVEKNLKMHYGNPDKITEEQVTRHYELMRREGNRDAYIGRVNQDDYNRTRRMKNIEIPALVMWGTEDKIIPIEHASFFHRDLPNSKLKMYPDSGHFLQEERPGETAQDIYTFVRSRK